MRSAAGSPTLIGAALLLGACGAPATMTSPGARVRTAMFARDEEGVAEGQVAPAPVAGN